MTSRALLAELVLSLVCFGVSISDSANEQVGNDRQSANQQEAATVQQEAAPQQPATNQTNQQTPATDQQQRSANFRGSAEQQVPVEARRASEIIGMEVRTPRGEDVGDVDDLVIDQSGRVRYAAVSVGGFLGIGEKLVAVPWEAFEFRRQSDQSGVDALTQTREFHLLLETTKERMEAAPGFDSENWPNFGDQRWAEENARHYNVRTEGDREQTRDFNRTPDRNLDR